MDTEDDPGREFTHGFHAYPARMHPLTARGVIAARLGKVSRSADRVPTVVDPFCGSGSVAVEAMRAGAAFVGGDVNPIGIEIAWVRTLIWPARRCEHMSSKATRISHIARDVAAEMRLPAQWIAAEADWYDAAALRDLLALRELIDKEDDADLRRVLRMVLSSIVVKISKQVSDATTVRDRHHKTVYAGVAPRLFRQRSQELSGQIDALRRDLQQRNVRRIEPRLVQADARNGGLVPPGTASLVLSSPPYLGTYDYLFHHARRYALLGLRADYADRHEIGSRRKAVRDPEKAVETYERDLRESLVRMREAIAEDGAIVLLLGDGLMADRRVAVDDMARRLAAPAGLRVVAVATQKRPNWLTQRGAATRAEHLIEFRRP